MNMGKWATAVCCVVVMTTADFGSADTTVARKLADHKCNPASRKHKDVESFAKQIILSVDRGTFPETAVLADCKVWVGQWASDGAVYTAEQAAEQLFDQRHTEDNGGPRSRLPFRVIQQKGNAHTYAIVMAGFRPWDKELHQDLRAIRLENSGKGWAWTGYSALARDAVEDFFRAEIAPRPAGWGRPRP